MPYLTWENKDEAIKKAKNTPYRLLREVAEFSHTITERNGKFCG
jgi:adenine-specific DNA-methyltransferase